MASIRRTLSPVPRPGTLLNGEACSVASPLSKSSSSNQNYEPSGGCLSFAFGSLYCSLYRAQAFVLGLFSQRSSMPLEKPKIKVQVWRRALFRFLICFVVGVFIGLTSFASINSFMNLMPKHQTAFFDVLPPVEKVQFYDVVPQNMTPLADRSSSVSNNTTLETHVLNKELNSGISNGTNLSPSLDEDPNLVSRKLLIIVTATYSRLFQAYYLNRLAHTLKFVPAPLLWIVVEMTSQSVETADTLRRTGVMYRHLVCSKNLTEIKDRRIHQRNMALSHIEMHHLDGIVYFADDDNIYAADLFEQMRQIRRFGTWTVVKLTQSKSQPMVEGPICNGTQVIGWHTNKVTRRFRRFHADMSGFAFNSTILWDRKRWLRPTLEPARQLDTVKEGFQVSTLIEQIVEDESQMEGLPPDCSKIMVWHLHV